jgi:hypothetical protein
LKQEVAKHLEDKADQLRIDDMIQWSLPLAAEQVTNQKIWKRFRDIIIEQPHKIQFKDYVNLVWSFAKVSFNDPAVWKQA